MATATQALIPKVARGVGENGIWTAYDRLYVAYVDQDARVKKILRETTSQKTDIERLTADVIAHKKLIAKLESRGEIDATLKAQI